MANTVLSKAGQAGNQKTMTCSVWFKPSGALGSENNLLYWKTDGSNFFKIKVPQGANKMDINNQAGSSNCAGIATMVFEDKFAWYHLVVKIDTTQAVEADRFRAYINGDEITAWDSRTYPSQDTDLLFNKSSSTNYIGSDGSSEYFNGYMAQFVWVDGTAYAPTTFGSTDATTGQWKPKSDGEIRSAVTFGTNGFLLPFSDGSNLGYDYQTSGRSTTNDYAKSGDGFKTQTNPSNNFSTGEIGYNPASGFTWDVGNTQVINTDSSWKSVYWNMSPSTGKWYWEGKLVAIGSGAIFGIADVGEIQFEYGNNFAIGEGDYQYVYNANGNKKSADSETAFGNTYTTGDIIGCALDLDNGKIYFSKNGVWQNSGDPTSGATGTGSAFDVETSELALTGFNQYAPAVACYGSGKWAINCGEGYFGTTAVSSSNADDAGLGLMEYDVPAGYYTLCTKNIKTYG